MVLLDPNGQPLLSDVPMPDGEALLACVEEHPLLQEACSSFLMRPRDPIPKGRRTLCVIQGECAYVSRPPGVDPPLILGSEAATTCESTHTHTHTHTRAHAHTRTHVRAQTHTQNTHNALAYMHAGLIVVVLDRATGAAWCSHFDESTCGTGGLKLLPALAGMRQPSLFLAGAFREPRGASRRTCARLLHFFHCEVPSSLRLELACIHSLNTDPATGGPKVVDLAVDCFTGEPYPAGFEDRGPELPRRFAYQGHRCDLTCLDN
jgi:hypothetical protein